MGSFHFPAILEIPSSFAEVKGTVVSRNILDSTIIIKEIHTQNRSDQKTITSEIINSINLTLWIIGQENPSITLLPDTNSVITMTNLKLVKQNKESPKNIYIALKSSKLTVLSQNTLLNTQHTGPAHNDNLLTVFQEFKLTARHLEIFIKFPLILPHFIRNTLQFYVFKTLTTNEHTKHAFRKVSRVQDCNFYDDEWNLQACIYTPSTLSQIGSKYKPTNNYRPYFGMKSSEKYDCLVGFFVSRLGKFFLSDSDTDVKGLLLHINCNHNSDLLPFNYRLVMITKFQMFSEMYSDGCIECVFVDFNDIFDVFGDENRSIFTYYNDSNLINPKLEKLMLIESKDDLPSLSVKFDEHRICIEAIAPASQVPYQDTFEVWMLVMNVANGKKFYWALEEQLLATCAYLDVDRNYVLYTTGTLKPYSMNFPENYLERVNGGVFKLFSSFAYFQPLNTTSALASNDEVTAPGRYKRVNALIDKHYLNDQPPSAAASASNVYQFSGGASAMRTGLLGRGREHRLSVTNGNRALSVYLKWQGKLMPTGLNPYAIVVFTNIQFTKSYLVSTAFSDVQIVGVADGARHCTTGSLNDNVGELNVEGGYESILNCQRLEFLHYVRTRVYIKSCIAGVKIGFKEIDAKFRCKDSFGEMTLLLESYPLFFKMMGISSDMIARYEEQLIMKSKLINLSCVRDIIQNTYALPPFAHKFFMLCAIRCSKILAMDVLCYKIRSSADAGHLYQIEDIFAVY